MIEGIIIFVVCLSLGALVLFYALKEAGTIRNFSKNSIRVDAVVVFVKEEITKVFRSYSKTYSLTVSYTVNDVKYESKLNISLPSFKDKKEGDIIPVHCLLSSPEKIRYTKHTNLSFWFCLMFSFAMFVGALISLCFGILGQ